MGEPKRTRLVFLGFAEEMVARYVLGIIRGGQDLKIFHLEDWVLLVKDDEGKLSITSDTGRDPGPLEGALFGGAVGVVLTAIAGPMAAGAMLGGAAIGALTAAIVDSGFKNEDLRTISSFMAAGRSGLVLAIPTADGDAFNEFAAQQPEFASAIRHDVDIVPGQSLAEAIEAFRREELS